MVNSEQSVFLKNLPAGLRFPEGMAARIRYDGLQQRLCFEGFMSKAQFDVLHGLSSDGEYQLAVEQLFELSVPGRAASSARGVLGASLFLVVVSLSGLAAAVAAGWCVWR